MKRTLEKLTFFLICAAMVLTTLAYGTVHQPLIALFYVFVAIIAVAWAAAQLRAGEVLYSRTLLQVPLLLFGVYGFLQVAGATSIDPFSTQVSAIHVLVLCVLFSITLSILARAKRLRTLASAITVFGAAYAFYAILQSVLSPDAIYGIYRPPTATPFGSFVNKHDFAAIIEMAVAVPLGLLFTGAVRRDRRLLLALAVLIMVSALLLSGSRGGLVAVIAEFIFLVIVTTRSNSRKDVVLKIALSIALLAAGIGGAIFVGGDTSLTRLSNAGSGTDISSSRFHIWTASIDVIKAHMPLGAGLGAFGQAYTQFDTTSGALRVEQAHNDYLQVLADAGIPGLILGAAFLFLFGRQGIRATRVKNTFRRGIAVGAFAGCFAILVHSAFDFVLHITAISVMFLVLLSMLVASSNDYKDDITEFDDPPSRPRRRASVRHIRSSEQVAD